MIRRPLIFLVLCGGAVIACALDNRVLNGTDSTCQETNQCADVAGAATGGRAAGGRANNAGSAARAGASNTIAGTSATPGGPGEGGEAGQEQVGPTNDCPDLDQNTVPDCIETAVTNPGFDTNVKGWSPEANGALSWESLDSWGSNTSGSIRVENRGTSNGPDTGLIYTGATQCVKLQPAHTYVIFAQMYARGPMITAFGSVLGRVFASADCSGTPLRVETSVIQGTVNLRLTLQTTIPAEPSAGSLLVELGVGKPASVTGSAVLNFDNVLVR